MTEIVVFEDVVSMQEPFPQHLPTGTARMKWARETEEGGKHKTWKEVKLEKNKEFTKAQR